MRKTSCLLAAALTWCAAAGAAPMPDLIWLSDAAPRRTAASDHAGHAGKHRDSIDTVISGESGNDLHSPKKHLWLRQGGDLARAGYLAADGTATAIDLLDARGKRSRIEVAAKDGLLHGQGEFADKGFYNAYLARRSVEAGVLHVRLAKAELLYGSCCIKATEVDPVQDRAIVNPRQPLEVVREHAPDEKLFTRIVSGDRLVFTVHRLGRPLPGAQVTMLTQQGWRKDAVSDDRGRVEFTMIRDYFPDWRDFKRRTKEAFVVVAEAQADETGIYQGAPYARASYQASLSGKYQLSPYDYKSYAWGLGLVVFVAVFGGLAVYLYRRRRLRPFREVRFDERA